MTAVTMDVRRIQLSRKRGWRMPPNTVIVSRPSKWGNPFKRTAPGVGLGLATNSQVVAAFEEWLCTTEAGLKILQQARQELRGKNLGCWCKIGEACHGDVLLGIANE